MTKKAVLIALLLCLIGAALSPMLHPRGRTALALAGFPTFSYQGVVINPDANPSRYPTGEVIFPSIIKASNYFSNPLGTYYLYYAPHDSPGGIHLAYSNSLNGPWTEYGTGPIISNNWSPHYSVSHVSSPHAFWNAAEGKLFLYFHGENTATRLATSTNGINFTYDSKVIGCSHFGFVSNCEVSYARVFEHTIPSKGNKYVMLLMGLNGTSNGRSVMLAWSNDGRNWTGQQTPLITPQGTEGSNLSGPHLFRWNGCACVAYHASSGDIHVADVGSNFDQQNHLGVLYDDPTGVRAAAPTFISIDGNTYMFYEQGARLDARIAYAVESSPTQEDIILDNNSPSGVTITGSWTVSTGAAGFYGINYLHDGNTGKGTKTVRYMPNLEGGTYKVYARWSAHPNRATNTPFIIVHSEGTTTITRNQQQNGGQWVLLGTFIFPPGTSKYVLISNSGTNGYVIADAIRFEQQ